MKTKIFCDIADYETIKFFYNKSIVSGFTTNPSLMRLAGAKNYKQYSNSSRKNVFHIFIHITFIVSMNKYNYMSILYIWDVLGGITTTFYCSISGEGL